MSAVRKLVRWIVSTEDQPWRTLPPPVPLADGARHGDLDLRLTGERRQRWDGCGGCFNELGQVALQRLPQEVQDSVLRDLFHTEEGCRFNLCRIPIGASDYAQSWYSLNETPGDYAMTHFSIARDREFLIPYIRAAQAWRPDLRFFASPWSPPTWMKQPMACNYGVLQWTSHNLEAYALYLALFVEAYGREGIPIEQVHVQNEPDSDQKFPSCVWTGEKIRDFVRDYLGPLCKSRGLDCEIWAGTIERADYHAWAGTILADPAARAFISGVGYQWAGQGAVQRTREAWPDLPMLQTESECGDGSNTWKYAHYVFSLIQHYVTNGVNGYIYWNMVLEPEGRSTWGWKQNSMITANSSLRTVQFNPEYYMMKHLSHFVEPGAICLELRGSACPSALAFENLNQDLVVLLHNPSPMDLLIWLDDASLNIALPPQSFHTLILN